MQASRKANAIIITLALLFGLATAAVAADEAIFKKTKQVVQEGEKSKEKDVALVFSEDENVVIRHRKKEEEVYATIPYSAITGLTYERSTHARAKTAILISPMALFSKGKKHWLTIEYKVGDKGDFVLLRLDKKEYQRLLATIEAQTGIDVERIIDS